MLTGIKERGKLLLALLFSAACLLNACGGGGGGGGPTPADIEDMQGVWKGTTNTQMYGEEQTTFTLTQNGSDISGTLKLVDANNNSWQAEANGSVNNSSANISSFYSLETGGNIEYAYNGTIEGSTFSGNINLFEDGVDTDQGGSFSVSKGSGGGGNGLTAPTLIKPIVMNGQVGAYCPITLVFEWSVVPDATNYQVFVLSAGHAPAVRIFDASLVCFDVCSTNEFPLEELPAGITQWFVRACDSSSCGPQSTTETFDILPANMCP